MPVIVPGRGRAVLGPVSRVVPDDVVGTARGRARDPRADVARVRQWWWPCRPRVSTGVAPGRGHCGTGRLVGPQVAFPSASERQYQQIGEPCPPTGEPT